MDRNYEIASPLQNTGRVRNDSFVLELFKESNALLEGHFLLSSGLHSNRYLQSALVLQDARNAEKLGKALAAKFPGGVDVVLSPALGGLIIGHEVARAKKARAIFAEKDAAGIPVLRRGFSIGQGEKVLVIEDVITTGLSTGEVVKLAREAKAEIAGIGAIVNRSGKKLGEIFPEIKALFSLLDLDVKSWKAEDCELCKKGIPAVKPGSRNK